MNNQRVTMLRSREWSIAKIKSDSQISAISFFDDEIWDLNNSSNRRLNSVPASKLRINWNRCATIPKAIIFALKALAFIYINQVKTRKGKSGQIFKAQTICIAFTYTLDLFNLIVQSSPANSKNSIFDIDAFDIDRAVREYRGCNIKMLKKIFERLTETEIISEIQRLTDDHRQLKWSNTDLKHINFRYEPVVDGSGRFSKVPLNDHLVYLLINQAGGDISGFLSALKIDQADSSFSEKAAAHSLAVNNFTAVFEDYIEIKRLDFESKLKRGRRQNYTGVERARFRTVHGISIKTLFAYLQKVSRAARYLILQFTGARYSESISFETGCLQVKFGNHFVRGTVIKGKGELNITNVDYWVAIPIVRDAVKVLELISKCTFKNHLFSSNHQPALKVKNEPYANGTLNQELNAYLVTIDVERRYSTSELKVKEEFVLSSHRIRTTLANQLHKCRKNLWVIAFQFHHTYTAIRSYNIPPEVTAGYGNIGKEIFNSAMHRDRVNREIVDSIYSPTSPVTGGGAVQFIKARNDFFAGEYKKGKDTETILNELAHKKLAFADVNLGYCGGKQPYSNETGGLVEPPCVGQMKCNPDCGNAVIPKSKIAHWKDYLKRNEDMLSDPRFSYAHETLQAHVDQAKRVLKTLTNETF